MNPECEVLFTLYSHEKHEENITQIIKENYTKNLIHSFCGFLRFYKD